MTSAINLSAKYIFNAITIDTIHLIFTSEESIRSATLNCLKKADSLQMKTIAFPARGTGVAKFPLDWSAILLGRHVRGASPQACPRASAWGADIKRN